jgi:hypothetical protein
MLETYGQAVNGRACAKSGWIGTSLCGDGVAAGPVFTEQARTAEALTISENLSG